MSSPGRNFVRNDRKRRRVLEFNDSDTEEHEDDVMDTTAFSSQAEGETSELMDPTASTKAVSERVSSVLDSYLQKTVAEGKEHESLDQTISSDLQSDQAEESNDCFGYVHHRTCRELIDAAQPARISDGKGKTSNKCGSGSVSLEELNDDSLNILSSQDFDENCDTSSGFNLSYNEKGLMVNSDSESTVAEMSCVDHTQSQSEGNEQAQESLNRTTESNCLLMDDLKTRVDSILGKDHKKADSEDHSSISHSNGTSEGEESKEDVASELSLDLNVRRDFVLEKMKDVHNNDHTVSHSDGSSEEEKIKEDVASELSLDLNVRRDFVLEKMKDVLDNDHTLSHSDGTSEEENIKEDVASELSIFPEEQEKLITDAKLELEHSERKVGDLSHSDSILELSATSNHSINQGRDISTFYRNILEKELKDTEISAAGNVSIEMNYTVNSLLQDESTSDGGQWPHVASTPAKIAVSSTTLPKLNALRALVADLDPIEPGESMNSSSAESDGTGSEAASSEEGSSSNADYNSDNSGEIDLLSNSVLERIENLGQDQESSEDDTEGIETNASPFYKAFLLNNVKIYPGKEFSVNDAILDLMDLYLKNKLTKVGVSRTLEFLCKYLPDNHKLLKNSHSVFEYIKSLAPPMSATKHYFCAQCSYYHGLTTDGLCVICKGETTDFKFFYYLDLSSFVKYFFEVRNLASIMDAEAEKEVADNALRNLRDGSVYKLINVNRNKYDLNIKVNIDGVRIRRDGKKELWPIMFTIEEVPIHLQKSFLTVCGVWYGTKKPNMKTFLKPLVEELEKLDHNGVEWNHPITKELHTSRVLLPVTILDAPVRALVQNTLAFNGIFGCNICEIKLKLSAPLVGKKRVRIYHYVHNPILRTKERMLNQASKALEENVRSVKGVKGPSVLTTIPSVDESKCIVPEYMHSVLLGVVRHVTKIWADGCLKLRLDIIDTLLKSCKHPDFVHRAVRQLVSVKNWKASDFYYFLFFEALPILENHLPDKNFQHFVLLVKGIFNLLKTSIKESDIKEAELLLQLFVLEFGALYGDRSLTHNVHQLLHLGMCVRRYGPLFCFCGFPYEDLNGLISKTTHGTTNIETEIVNNITISQGIQSLRNIVRGQHDLHASAYSPGELLGKDVKRTLLSLPAEEVNILDDDSAKIFARAKIGYDMYTSEIYKSLNSQNFYVMWKDTAERKKFGTILYFAHSKGEDFIVIRLFAVNNTRVFFHRATRKCIEHIVPVDNTNTCVAIRIHDIVSSIVKVGKIGSYLFLRPHLYRFVM